MSMGRDRILKAMAFVSLLFILFVTSFFSWGYFYADGVLSDFTGAGTVTALFDQTSFLYDQSGNLISEIHAEINRVPVPLEKIPDHVQKAFVAIEDERFYSHPGVDVKAILRAVMSFYKSGRITEGASTITQQVMKLYFLSPEQSLRRKVKEAALALEFESRYTKDEILEFYLNRVYFGEGAYGIQSAAKVYFNKDSSELTLSEGALLAALVQAPSSYDPYINPEGSLRRRDVVIKKMIQQGFIREEQGMEACERPLDLTKKAEAENNHSFFIDQILDEAVRAVGEERLFRGGLKIYSTLEPEIQKKAEKVFQQSGLFPSKEVEAALALVENGTGAVKALIGGREYEARRGFNRATQLSRQPGSAFKPIAVYAPAFESGYGPDSIISDTPFKLGNYEPQNSGGGYYGPIRIRTAVQWSRNVAAVRLLDQMGIDRGYEMAKKMGFELTEEDRCLPLALGGLTKGVSPLQMAGAYAAFANQGIFIKPYTIHYIEDANGQTLYRRPEGVPVMKASTAETMKEVLRSVVDSGTGYRAAIRGVDVAGKTGTTELPDTPVFRGLNGNKDAWFVGFTPRFTAAVWMGYDEKDMDRQHYLTSYGGNQPAEIFRLVMAGVLGLDERLYARENVGQAPETENRQDDPGAQEEEKQVPVKTENPLDKQKGKGEKRREPEEAKKQDGGSKGQDTVKEEPLKGLKPTESEGQKKETTQSR